MLPPSGIDRPLVNDGFVAEVGDRWRFRSGMLRRYWVKYIRT